MKGGLSEQSYLLAGSGDGKKWAGGRTAPAPPRSQGSPLFKVVPAPAAPPPRARSRGRRGRPTGGGGPGGVRRGAGGPPPARRGPVRHGRTAGPPGHGAAGE